MTSPQQSGLPTGEADEGVGKGHAPHPPQSEWINADPGSVMGNDFRQENPAGREHAQHHLHRNSEALPEVSYGE